MIRRSGSIQLSSPLYGPHTIKTKTNIQKVKTCLRRTTRALARRLSAELGISATSVRRIFKKPFETKIVVEPSLSDDQKNKGKQFVNWVRINFRKEDILEILFSNEKIFYIDGVYNAQNTRV